MFACDHSRRRSGRPTAAQIDAFAIEASHNDDDHGCKIITLPGHFPLVVKNRSEAAARAFHSAFPRLRRTFDDPTVAKRGREIFRDDALSWIEVHGEISRFAKRSG
jgi:hypothetical protein